MVTPEFTALERKVRKNLEHLQHQLHIIQAGITVATQFLKAQDAEQDRDVACILEHCVGNRLSRQLERTNALLATLAIHVPDYTVSSPQDPESPPLQ